MLVDVLLGVVVVAGTLLLAALHSGCGASALRTHVAAAAVVTVALEGGEAAIAAETHRRLDGCAGDAACMESTALELHHAVERTGIEAAFVTVRGLTVSYVEAVRVAALAGDVASVLPYLLEMAGRIAAEWRTLADGMRLLGLELPVPPPLLAASVGGAS